MSASVTHGIPGEREAEAQRIDGSSIMALTGRTPSVPNKRHLRQAWWACRRPLMNMRTECHRTPRNSSNDEWTNKAHQFLSCQPEDNALKEHKEDEEDKTLTPGPDQSRRCIPPANSILGLITWDWEKVHPLPRPPSWTWSLGEEAHRLIHVAFLGNVWLGCVNVLSVWLVLLNKCIE